MFSTPWASVLDCTATRVNQTTPHNMQVHAHAVVAGLRAREAGRALLDSTTCAFLFIHGCGTTFPGLMGLQFVGKDSKKYMDLLSENNAEAYAQTLGGDAAREAFLRKRRERRAGAEGQLVTFSMGDCPGEYNLYTSAVRCICP